jgi:hypothetical protein
MKNYTIEQEKHKLLSQIRIIDDFLPDYDFEKFKVEYKFESMEETMRDGSYIGKDNEFPKLGESITIHANIQLQKINYGKIVKTDTQVLIVSDVNSPFTESRHCDDTKYSKNGYTLSYHWMGVDNAGGTHFFLDFQESTPLLSIPFKQNRLVVFPARIPHQGYANQNYAYKSKRAVYTLFSVLEDFT